MWDPTGVDLDSLHPIFVDFADHRRAQRDRFGGDLFPNLVETSSGLVFTEFFQNDRDGSTNGIVVIDLTRSKP